MRSDPDDPLDTPSNLQLGRGLIMALVGMTIVLMYLIGFPFDELEYRRRGRSYELSETQTLLLIVFFGGIGVFGIAQAVTAKMNWPTLAKCINVVGRALLYASAVLLVGGMIFGV